jgi:hypothetical protein
LYFDWHKLAFIVQFNTHRRSLNHEVGSASIVLVPMSEGPAVFARKKNQNPLTSGHARLWASAAARHGNILCLNIALEEIRIAALRIPLPEV